MSGKIRQLWDIESVKVAALLIVILNIFFFPAIWGNKSLLTSSGNVPSIMPSGAYGGNYTHPRFHRTDDPGAPGWGFEAKIKMVGEQWKKEGNIPLWNPYNAYGKPLAANMTSQPFYPLTFLLSILFSVQSYNIFIIMRLFIMGFFAFLFLRWFLEIKPALFGSIVAMFSGYYIIFLNIEHLSVEVLLPAIFYSFELCLRKLNKKSIFLASSLIWLTIVGGMPESTFLILTFGYLYFVFRIIVDESLWQRKFLYLRNLVIANVIGFFLSAPLMLAFIEFMKRSFDVHQSSNMEGQIVGLFKDNGFGYAITYLLPLVFGPPHQNILDKNIAWTGLRGYWGIVPFIFSILAVLVYFRARKKDSVNLGLINWLVVFFTVSAVFFILKRFGVFIVNWVGYLPFAQYVIFPKYQEPLLGFSIAILSAVGFHAITSNEYKLKHGILANFIGGMVLVGFVVFWIKDIIIEAGAKKYIFFTNVIYAIALIFIIVVLLLCLQRKIKLSNIVPDLFIGLVSVELFFNFIFPCFYSLSKLPEKEHSPYNGAEYINFLKDTNKDKMRVFGKDMILFPNWSATFGIFDVRDLDAMYYNRYINFIRAFLVEPNKGILLNDGDEMFDRFTGKHFKYDFKTVKEKNFLALSSVKYILSMNKFNDEFEEIYNKEIKIYEHHDVLPRASVFHSIELFEKEDEVLRWLVNSSTAIVMKEVGIEKNNLTEAKKMKLESFKDSTDIGEPVTKAKILSYDSQKVVIETELDRAGVLMLNDSNYPGWKVYVDDTENEILKADYLFRGVYLEKGKHKVEFIYEPTSFRLGVIVLGVTILSIAVYYVGKIIKSIGNNF